MLVREESSFAAAIRQQQAECGNGLSPHTGTAEGRMQRINAPPGRKPEGKFERGRRTNT